MGELKIEVSQRRWSYLPIRDVVGILAFLAALGLPALTVAAAEEGSGQDFDAVFDLLEQEQMVVSSAGLPQPIEEAPNVVSIITKEQILRRGYRSLAEALEHLPGLSFVDDHILPNLTIRGVFGGVQGWGRFIKVMINGQPIAFHTTNTNWLGLSLVPLDIVERIEVVRGPGSSLYGANAFLGVVNIITISGNESPKFLLHSAATNVQGNGGYEGGFVATHRDDNLYAQLAFSGAHEDRSGTQLVRTFSKQSDVTLPLGEKTQDDHRTPKTLYAAAGYTHPTFGNFRLDAFGQQLHTAGEFFPDSIMTHRTHLSLMNGYGRVQWTKTFLNRIDARLDFAIAGGGPGRDEVLDFGLSDYVYKRRMDYKGGNTVFELTYRHDRYDTLKFGVDYSEYNESKPSGIWVTQPGHPNLPAGATVPRSDFARETFSNLGVYLQGQYGIYDFALLTAGARLDRHNLYGDDLSTRAGVVFLLPYKLSLKVLYGTSIMAPAADQLFASPDFGEGSLTGNPDLRTQKASVYEAALDFNPSKWLTLRLDGYYTEVTDKIEFERISVNTRPKNRDVLKIYGVEVEVNSKIGPLTLDASGSVGKGSREDPQFSGFIVNAADELFPAVPWTSVALGIGYALPRYFLNLYAETRYRSAMQPTGENFSSSDNNEDYLLPARWTVDLHLTSLGLDLLPGKMTDDVVFYAKINNLLDDRSPQPGFSDVDIPSLGRSMIFGARVKFP